MLLPANRPSVTRVPGERVIQRSEPDGTRAGWYVRLTAHLCGRRMARANVMTTDTVRAAPAPLKIARGLAPRIRERADEIEAGRQLPRDLVLEIANTGLFKVALSQAEGGLGADILTTLGVIEEVARADGSTGWCLAMGINSFRQSAQFTPEVRRTLFHSAP